MDVPINPISNEEYENLEQLMIEFCHVPLLAEFSRPVFLFRRNSPFRILALACILAFGWYESLDKLTCIDVISARDYTDALPNSCTEC